MNAYVNDQLDIEGLPSLEDIDWVEMDRNLIVRDVIRNCVFSILILILLGVFAISFLSLDMAMLRIIGVVGFCIGFAFIILLLVWPRLEFPHRGYALRELDFAQKRGLVTRYLATVPFSRVQHVSVSQGVLDRMFNLATLQIYTAGGGSSIRGFLNEDAHALREHILERVAEINAVRVEDLDQDRDQLQSESEF